MRTLILFLFLTLTAYGSNRLLQEYKTSLGIQNGCMINAIAFQDQINHPTNIDASTKKAAQQLSLNSNRWDRIILIQFRANGKIVGHAICVFAYKEKLWIYDSNYGTYCIQNGTDNEDNLEFLTARWQSPYNVITSIFVDDVPPY